MVIGDRSGVDQCRATENREWRGARAWLGRCSGRDWSRRARMAKCSRGGLLLSAVITIRDADWRISMSRRGGGAGVIVAPHL